MSTTTDTATDRAPTTTTASPVETPLDPALEIPPTESAHLVRRDPAAAVQPIAAPAKSLGILKPIAPIAEILEQQNALRAFIKQALVEDRDYGKIPGVEKPTLLKPGAERINAAYGVIARFSIVEQEIDHDRVNEWRKEKRRYSGGTWTGDVDVVEGKSFGLYRVVMLCELVHRETGIVIGSCIGSCSTLESKYIDRPRDCENTIYKMAEKRSLVGAALLAYGLSDEFTQDVEDTGAGENGETVADAATGPAKVTPPICPVHNVAMKDFRARKKNVKAPDWKCTQHEMRGGSKVWCEEVKWPGEWPQKGSGSASGSASGAPEENPPRPAGQNGPSSAGSDAPRSPADTASNSSSDRGASTPGTPTGRKSPASSPSSGSGTPKSPDSSRNTASGISSGSGATSTTTTATGTGTGESITRSTVIDWATGQFKPIHGKRLQDLHWEQLDYFRRNRPSVLPPGWFEAIVREITLREDTGDERADDPEEIAIEDATARHTLDDDPYR